MNILVLQLKGTLLILLAGLFLSSFTIVIPNSGIYEGGIKFEIESDDARVKALVKQMKYDENSNQIDIVTNKEVIFLELFKDNGDLLFMVPIGSNTINLGVSTYPKGIYYLKMMLEGEDAVMTTKIIKDF